MKKFIFLLVLSACVISCRKSDSPKEVADSFLQAWSKADFEEAKEYGTEESKKLLDMMNSFKTMSEDSSFSTEISYDITREKVEGDNATVYYKEEGSKGEQALNLIRVNGEWKVNMSKESINGAEGDGTIDIGATNTDTTTVDSADGEIN